MWQNLGSGTLLSGINDSFSIVLDEVMEVATKELAGNTMGKDQVTWIL